MKIEIIKSLTDNFESFAKQTETGWNFGWLEIYSIFLDMKNGLIFRVLFLKQKRPVKTLGIKYQTILPASAKWIILVQEATERCLNDAHSLCLLSNRSKW